jgi:hypothetical protein
MADLNKMEITSGVLAMLIPTGGYVLRGDDFTDVEWIEATPITKAQFDKGLADYSAWKAQQDAKAAADKAAILAKIGLTADEVKLLLG